MIRRPPRSTRTDTLFPYTTLFRSLVRLFGDMDDVLITPFRAAVVDTDAAGLVAPIQVLQGVDHLGACRYLLFRRHCILKLEENMRGSGRCGISEQRLARGRDSHWPTTTAAATLTSARERSGEKGG